MGRIRRRQMWKNFPTVIVEVLWWIVEREWINSRYEFSAIVTILYSQSSTYIQSLYLLVGIYSKSCRVENPASLFDALFKLAVFHQECCYAFVVVVVFWCAWLVPILIL